MSKGKQDQGAFALVLIDLQREFWSKQLQRALHHFCFSIETSVVDGLTEIAARIRFFSIR